MATEQVGAIEIGGRRLAWRSVGEGPPMLLVNGYAATAADWDPNFLAALGSNFEVICPDNRGMGGSEPGDYEAEPLSIDSMAADLEALLDARAIESLPVAGWSMGGFVAQALTSRAPQRVEALALLATDPGGPDVVYAAAEAWQRLTDSGGTPREQASRIISLLFPPEPAAIVDRDFGEIVAAARAQLSPTALRAQEAAMLAWHESAPTTPSPAPPVLVVSGSEDRVIPAANEAGLAARWPGAETERIEGAGHGLMAQDPQRVAGLIAGFFGRA